MTASFTLFKLFRLRDVFPGDLYQQMLCEVCLLSGFQLQIGDELKGNHLSCYVIHPPFGCEKFQLQLYKAELRLRTVS